MPGSGPLPCRLKVADAKAAAGGDQTALKEHRASVGLRGRLKEEHPEIEKPWRWQLEGVVHLVQQNRVYHGNIKVAPAPLQTGRHRVMAETAGRGEWDALIPSQDTANS